MFDCFSAFGTRSPGARPRLNDSSGNSSFQTFETFWRPTQGPILKGNKSNCRILSRDSEHFALAVALDATGPFAVCTLRVRGAPTVRPFFSQGDTITNSSGALGARMAIAKRGCERVSLRARNEEPARALYFGGLGGCPVEDSAPGRGRTPLIRRIRPMDPSENDNRQIAGFFECSPFRKRFFSTRGLTLFTASPA